MTTHLQYVESVREIPFTDMCVVIADNTLPSAILDVLPDPVLVSPGEELKSLVSIEQLADAVLQRRASRPLTIAAVGGGSVGDAAGFLASILWRGVNLWHIPTTLLAIIDSAHGGKTAVNLPHAKNQLGTFHPAEKVFVVRDIIRTLPSAVRRDGLSELLKVFLISADTPFEKLPSFEALAFAPFEEIESRMFPLIESAIRIKMKIVEQDPYERTGMRALLNLGHTFGHALERVTGMTHGASVAWGLAAMLEISKDSGLDPQEANRIFHQLYPLLTPVPDTAKEEALIAAILRDKKHANRTLRSVILERLHRPVLTDTVSPQEWLDAFATAKRRFLREAVRVSVRSPRPVELRMEAAKSGLIRGLVIAALRPGETVLRGVSHANDVLNTYSALRQMGFALEKTPEGFRSLRGSDVFIPERSSTVSCGEGAATFRFLLAVAASMRREVTLLTAPGLFERPHDALIHTLTEAGAAIAPYRSPEGNGFHVNGWDAIPAHLSIDGSLSSQYISAIALLSAGIQQPLTIRLDRDTTSTPYLRLTLDMLEQAGVEVIYRGYLIALNPTDALREPVTLDIAPDASSAAVWHVARYLGHPVELTDAPDCASIQPDACVEKLLRKIGDAQDGMEINLSETPDLLPVLTIAALRTGKRIRFTGIERLKYKESDRIGGFASSLQHLGIPMQRIPDGLITPLPGEIAFQPGSVFHTLSDHRLVMAGALLGLLFDSVQLDAPWAVTKSYPHFWNDARKAGWSMDIR